MLALSYGFNFGVLLPVNSLIVRGVAGMSSCYLGTLFCLSL